MYYATAEIEERVPDFDITKVDIQQIPNADIVTALQNGAVDCGILLDPTWLQVADDPGYFLAATQTPGEPVGGIMSNWATSWRISSSSTPSGPAS